jgi:hypothetical protein
MLYTLLSPEDVKIVYFNLLRTGGCFMQLRVWYSKILHAAHIAFMCFVEISEQTATFTLHNINRFFFHNRGGEGLLRGTHYILIYSRHSLSLKGLLHMGTSCHILVPYTKNHYEKVNELSKKYVFYWAYMNLH